MPLRAAQLFVRSASLEILAEALGTAVQALARPPGSVDPSIVRLTEEGVDPVAEGALGPSGPQQGES